MSLLEVKTCDTGKDEDGCTDSGKDGGPRSGANSWIDGNTGK